MKHGIHRPDVHAQSRTHMAKRVYFVADIGVFGYVDEREEAGLSIGRYPAIMRWFYKVCGTDGLRPLPESGQDRMRAA